MKKWLGSLMAVGMAALLLIGCAVGLKSLKPGMSVEQLIAVAATMPPDADGWRMLSIPAKDYNIQASDTYHMEFVIYVHPRKKIQGFAIVWDEGVLCLQQTENQWVFFGNAMLPTPMDENKAQELIGQFIKMLNKDGDFAKAGSFKLRTAEEVPKQEA